MLCHEAFFDQGTLTRAGHSGHHSQHMPGYLGVGFSDVVGSDLVYCVEALRRHRRFVCSAWI